MMFLGYTKLVRLGLLYNNYLHLALVYEKLDRTNQINDLATRC